MTFLSREVNNYVVKGSDKKKRHRRNRYSDGDLLESSILNLYEAGLFDAEIRDRLFNSINLSVSDIYARGEVMLPIYDRASSPFRYYNQQPLTFEVVLKNTSDKPILIDGPFVLSDGNNAFESLSLDSYLQSTLSSEHKTFLEQSYYRAGMQVLPGHQVKRYVSFLAPIEYPQSFTVENYSIGYKAVLETNNALSDYSNTETFVIYEIRVEDYNSKLSNYAFVTDKSLSEVFVVNDRLYVHTDVLGELLKLYIVGASTDMTYFLEQKGVIQPPAQVNKNSLEFRVNRFYFSD